MEMTTIWFILASIFTFCLVVNTLFKYSFITSSATIPERDIDTNNFFHRKLSELRKNIKKYNTAHYITNTISLFFGGICVYNILRDNTLVFALTPILAIVAVYLLLHFVLLGFAITHPMAMFSTMYYPFKMIESVLLLPILAFRLAEKMFFKLLNTSDKLIFLSPEQREVALSSIDENSMLSKDVLLNENDIEMINSIFDFKDTTVKEVMVPRINMFGIDIRITFDELIEQLKNTSHSRIPVYEENVDNIKGLLYIKDVIKLLNNETNSSSSSSHWTKLLREPYFIPTSKKIGLLLAELKQKKTHIAIVVDEFGGTAGLVTMEDILEEIVGDIEDEYDNNPNEIKKINDHLYIIAGHASIYDIEESTDIKFNVPEDTPYDSLSGFIQFYCENVPDEGFSLDKNGVKFTVIKKQGPKILKVKVELTPTKDNKR